MSGDRERFLAGGFTGYLSKPIDVGAFAEQVESFLPRATPDDPVVLVVDDEPMARKAIERGLRNVCRVESVADGDAALARLRAGARYALVLCDVMMPRVTGLDVADALRAEMPDQLERFVFVTGGARDLRGQERLDASGIFVLAKPFSRAQLLEVVTPYLEAATQPPGPPLVRRSGA